jgi:hypothetical protein
MWLLSGFLSDFLPDKVGLKSQIAFAFLASSQHLNRMYIRTLVSAYHGGWELWAQIG